MNRLEDCAAPPAHRDILTIVLKVSLQHQIGNGFPKSVGSLLACVALSSCVSLGVPQPEVTPEAEPKPAQKAKPEHIPKAKPKPAQIAKPKTTKPSMPDSQAKPQPIPAPESPLKPTGTQALSRVAILVSDDSPAYTRVADELASRLQQRAKVYSLNGELNGSDEIVDQLQRSDRQQVVAIGLPAARVARRLSDKQVIFCQVFNFQDYELITPWMKGVSMVPQLSDLFRVWKALDPSLQQVGAITGHNQEHTINQARRAAELHGITVVHRVVGSDKEALYVFKNLAPEIQGLWLLPDNRVLSRQVIRQIMSYGVRQGKQVSVFHPQLLEVGGLISVKSRDSDIATQVLARLNQSHGKENIPGPDVTPLSKTQLLINAAMAKRLGLVIPQEYRKLVYDR
jgi:ABC-type uncharacterized transport system substrate-binding protein